MNLMKLVLVAAACVLCFGGCAKRGMPQALPDESHAGGGSELALPEKQSDVFTVYSRSVHRRESGGYTILTVFANRVAGEHAASLEEVADYIGSMDGVVVETEACRDLQPLSDEEIRLLRSLTARSRE